MSVLKRLDEFVAKNSLTGMSPWYAYYRWLFIVHYNIWLFWLKNKLNQYTPLAAISSLTLWK